MDQRPNILPIVTYQQRRDTIGAYGSQFEQSEIAYPLLHLKLRPNSPDMFGQKRWFLPDDLALVPWFRFLARTNDVSDRFHESTPHD